MIPAPTVESTAFAASGRPTGRPACASPGFTLIELILVMAVLTVVISLTAPALANFFRGRSLDSEARRLLALARQGQSRAVSEGVPMELWLDAKQRKFGLEAEPSFETEDLRAVEFTLAEDMELEVRDDETRRRDLSSSRLNRAGTMIAAPALTRREGLPRIRFLPDGLIDDDSPQVVVIIGRDGHELVLAQTRNRVSYELQRRNP
ncbi:MAG TPA: prepilin-type N-terminal cleavage/methylation domain-containing protein [Candidatus Paceibacterota bacterium]|jgi:type II secretion system protein H|nr:prepilin-type N-terminal cleavage/methylation domain-containing protein [Candidatus Paceibacterota bacterium]